MSVSLAKSETATSDRIHAIKCELCALWEMYDIALSCGMSESAHKYELHISVLRSKLSRLDPHAR